MPSALAVLALPVALAAVRRRRPMMRIAAAPAVRAREAGVRGGRRRRHAARPGGPPPRRRDHVGPPVLGGLLLELTRLRDQASGVQLRCGSLQGGGLLLGGGGLHGGRFERRGRRAVLGGLLRELVRLRVQARGAQLRLGGLQGNRLLLRGGSRLGRRRHGHCSVCRPPGVRRPPGLRLHRHIGLLPPAQRAIRLATIHKVDRVVLATLGPAVPVARSAAVLRPALGRRRVVRTAGPASLRRPASLRHRRA
mmetsp:Transcript_97782/g.254856  ORF Transcript_97782/g.254856 Transcript_97782/m.254856 type:complete len:251 (-) Transcript_97782:244-996(-)